MPVEEARWSSISLLAAIGEKDENRLKRATPASVVIGNCVCVCLSSRLIAVHSVRETVLHAELPNVRLKFVEQICANLGRLSVLISLPCTTRKFRCPLHLTAKKPPNKICHLHADASCVWQMPFAECSPPKNVKVGDSAAIKRVWPMLWKASAADSLPGTAR